MTEAAPRRRRPATGAASAPASVDGLQRLLDAFSRFADRQRIPDRARQEIYIALDELVSNAVKHRRAIGGRVSLDLSLSDDVLHAVVRNNGAPFDPLSNPRPSTDTPLLERPIGGLGLLFVEELMDSVSYERAGVWNSVTLMKQIRAPAE